MTRAAGRMRLHTRRRPKSSFFSFFHNRPNYQVHCPEKSFTSMMMRSHGKLLDERLRPRPANRRGSHLQETDAPGSFRRSSPHVEQMPIPLRPLSCSLPCAIVGAASVLLCVRPLAPTPCPACRPVSGRVDRFPAAPAGPLERINRINCEEIQSCLTIRSFCRVGTSGTARACHLDSEQARCASCCEPWATRTAAGRSRAPGYRCLLISATFPTR